MELSVSINKIKTWKVLWVAKSVHGITMFIVNPRTYTKDLLIVDIRNEH